ncbi:MAG: pantetheine-phosphate adenylyltransferase [Clostridia bacterium]|nr:pantetheine-phosphate adenylyltransferase [Clostridia bacterium]
MKTAIYPGSFDPVTNGHLDIIHRSAEIFDHLIVAVSVNRSKRPLFTVEERIHVIEKVTKDIKNIEIVTFDGLLADYAKKRDAKVIIKGLRAVSDFEYEFQMALLNKSLNPNTETLFMATSQNYSFLSSSIVKEIGALGGDLNGLVPEPIIDEIKQKLK